MTGQVVAVLVRRGSARYHATLTCALSRGPARRASADEVTVQLQGQAECRGLEACGKCWTPGGYDVPMSSAEEAA